MTDERELIEQNTATWTIPPWANPPAPGERPGFCRSCGATIMWVETKAGKRAPLNADGVNHFATCPQAASWRRRKGRDDGATS